MGTLELVSLLHYFHVLNLKLITTITDDALSFNEKRRVSVGAD